MTNNYNSDHYQPFENANGLVLNNIAYQVIGQLAIQQIQRIIPPSQTLRVADMGCYWGSSTARWAAYLSQTQLPFQILGIDIHADNIQRARQIYPELHFAHIQEGTPLPLIGDMNYHLLFATFVLDTIDTFQDVETLCLNMLNATLKTGLIYLLRLHPGGLKHPNGWEEYQFQPHSPWQHGDRLIITLSNGTDTRQLNDRFWEPTKIANVFRDHGCTVNLIPINLKSRVAPLLKSCLENAKIDQDLPEWQVPLFQIIQIRRP